MTCHKPKVDVDSKLRPPSIRDVAREAGVSHQTVSRVLNKHPSVKLETKELVLRVIAELNYRPNQAARALATSRSKTIGILQSSRAEYGPSASIASIELAARDAGYWVSTANVDGSDPISVMEGVGHLLAQAVDGLVVVAPQVSVLETLANMSIVVPYVTLQSTSFDDAHGLGVDQEFGARLATRHLIELGHRSIHHLAGPQNWIEADARMQGFLKEMTEHDLPVAAPFLGDWTAEFGYHAGRELLHIRDFTAVFCSNDQMALGMIHAVRDAGLSVPRDISVVGFDDIPEAAHYFPPLTTVRQDFRELGRRCVSVLLGGLSSEAELYSGNVQPELVVRSSTAPAAF